MHPLSFEEDLSQRIHQAQPSMLFAGHTLEELTAWQAGFQEKLISLLGIRPDRAELDLNWGEPEECGSYTRQPLHYQTEPGVRVPAYLLVPPSATPEHPAPGILCLHGHGHFGKDSIVGIADSPERQAEVAQFRYDFGHRFAARGYVVLAPDLRGFGERRPGYPGPRVDYCPRNYMAATLLGYTVVGLQVCDLHAAVDLLQSLPCVDGRRLAAAGLSYGGRMTMMISALDERIRICVPSGCMNLFQERYQALTQCGAQLIPNLLRYGDTPEIFSLIAPRPMILEIGLRDPLIPHDWMEQGLTRIRKAYQAAGATDRLWIDSFDGEHQFHFDTAITILERWRQGELEEDVGATEGIRWHDG